MSLSAIVKKSIKSIKGTLFPSSMFVSIISHDLSLKTQTSIKKRHLYMPPRRCHGSYTVEAAVLLPVFLMFSVTVFFFLKAEYIQWRVGEAMTETLKEVTLYGKEVDPAALELAFAANGLVEKLPIRSIKGGVLGFDFSETEVKDSKITFAVDYEVAFPFSVFGKNALPISQKRTGRIWDGSIPGADDTDNLYVYVTPYGTAYHRSRLCPYINPSIRSAPVAQVSFLRNSSGGRYKRCPRCARGSSSICYITSWGTNYHYKISCSGLKRTIYQIPLEKAKLRYHACSKCGG